MKKLKGSVSISRLHCSDEPYHRVSIKMRDEMSGLIIAEAELTMKEFAMAVTGGTGEEVDIDYYGSPYLGMKREVKYVIMPRPKYNTTDEECKIIAAPFEIDGWKANIYDMRNHHNWVEQDKVSVGMARFVDVDAQSPADAQERAQD